MHPLAWLWSSVLCSLCVLVLLGSVVCCAGEGLKSLDVCCWINGSCLVLFLVEDDHSGCDCCCGARHHPHRHPHTGSMITSVAAHKLSIIRWSFPPLLFLLPVFPWKTCSAPCTCGPSLHQHKPKGIYSAGSEWWSRKQIVFVFVRTWWEMFKERQLHARNGIWRKHILNPWAQNKGFLWDLQGKVISISRLNVFIVLCVHMTHQWLHLLDELLKFLWSKGLRDVILVSILDPCEMNTIS